MINEALLWMLVVPIICSLTLFFILPKLTGGNVSYSASAMFSTIAFLVSVDEFEKFKKEQGKLNLDPVIVQIGIIGEVE